MTSLLLLCLLGFSQVLCANIRVDPLVKIDQGLVRGEKSSDGSYSFFLGIPYAQVDSENPFGPAQPSPVFDGIFEAYDDSIKCPQVMRDEAAEGTLDCLRLNIYVPSQASSKNPVPVFVWIHGGGFSGGSGGQFEASRLIKQGIIIVSINYRLGAYGFMCLDTPEVPGNQGLKDQYAALQWVRDNIAAFGGNPYQVTVGGQSAGSGSVLYHLYSSKDKLYTKVILQSGNPQVEGMFVKKDTEAAIKIARYLGFDTSDTQQALRFLKDASPNLVVAATQRINLDLKPCKEKSFKGIDRIVDENPFSLFNERKGRTTPVLIGHTSKEHNMGQLISKNGLEKDPFYEKLQNNFNLDDNVLTKLAEIVRHFYIGDETLSGDLISVLDDFDSDFGFNHPTQRTVTNLLEMNAPAIYQYMFSYGGESGSTNVGHGGEMKYLFDSSTVPRNEDDELMVDRLSTLWANFVKHGNPTPEVTDLLPVTWESVSKNLRPYLILDKDIRLEYRIYNERMAFWDLLYSVFGEYNTFADSD